MTLSYSALYSVPYYDVDVTRKMTLKALIRVAIQFSEDQCRFLGQTEDYIKSLGVSWVIMQYEIKVTRLPVINEEVKITTEASSYNLSRWQCSCRCGSYLEIECSLFFKFYFCLNLIFLLSLGQQNDERRPLIWIMEKLMASQ
ncbi:MAG: hypothetical protein LBI41_04675 [Lactobacillales bacterium]|nr:hypothetical protein [Lactobacillales bacterium]